jgi:hypothetical protein
MDLKTNNRLCFSGDRFNVWKLGFSPIKLHELEEFLKLYPNKTAAYELLDGFSNGFRILFKKLIAQSSRMNGTTFHTIMTVNTITPKTTFSKVIIITWSLTSIIRESRVLKTRSTLSNKT